MTSQGDMNCFHNAININNECVQLMKEGNISCVILALQRAIVYLQAFNTQVENHSFPSECDRSTWFGFDQCPCGADQSGIFYIYDNLIQLPTVADDMASPEDLSSRVFVVSTSILFNSAIVYHRHGIQNGDAESLIIAGQLYDMVISILYTVNGKHASHGVLRCLALNNRSHIFYEYCNYRESMLCLDEMCDLLMVSDCLEEFITEGEAAEIKRNIVYLHPPCAASCA